MGIEIPDELQWVAKYILGAGDWPDGDETAMRRVADGWTAMANTLNTVDDDAAKALNIALAAISEGETHTSIATFRDKLLSGDQATFAAVRKWCETQAELLDDGANDIEHTKLVIIGTMIVTAVELTVAAVTSWTGVGAVVGVAARVAAQVAIRMAIRQLIARMLTRGAAKAAARLALRGAAFEALEEGGVDLAARMIQVSNGDRTADNFGWTDLGLATFGGAVGGAVGGVLGGGTGALGDVASSTAGKVAGKVVGGTVTELGADLSAQVAAAGVGTAFLGREFQLDIGVDTFTSAGAGGVQTALESGRNGGNAAAPTVPELGAQTPGATTPAATDTPTEPADPAPAGTDTASPTDDASPTTPAGTDSANPSNSAPTTPAGTGSDSPTAAASAGDQGAAGNGAPSPQNNTPDAPTAGDSSPETPNSNGANGTSPTNDSAPSNTDANGPTDSAPPSTPNSPTAPESSSSDTEPASPDSPTETPSTGDTTQTNPNADAPAENPTPPTSDTSSTNPPSPTGSSLNLPSQDVGNPSSSPAESLPTNSLPTQQHPAPPAAENATPPAAPTTPESTPQQSPISTPAASTTPQPATQTNSPAHTPFDTTRPSTSDASTGTATTTTAPPSQTANPTPTSTPTSTPPPTATPTSTPTPAISPIPTPAPSSPRSNTPTSTPTPPSAATPTPTVTSAPRTAPPIGQIPSRPTTPSVVPETLAATSPDSHPDSTPITNPAQTTPQTPTPSATPTNQLPDPGYSPDARPLRDALRNQPPHDGRTTTVDANQNPSQPRPSYRVRRFQVGNRWVSVATIRAHIPNTHLMTPAELNLEIEYAQTAVDAAFNHDQDLLSRAPSVGDRFVVDLEFTTDPSAADLRLNTQQHQFDLANDLRAHMGLPRSTPDTPLSLDDLRTITNDIARANTPSPLPDMPRTRVFAPGYLRGVEIPTHQHAVEDALRDGNRFIVGADPRTNPYGGLINDGGPHVTGRNINCLDASLAALASFNGRPEVSAPRTVDLDPDGTPSRRGERNGLGRAETWLGGQWQTFASPSQSVPQQFQALHDWISQMGPGSSALVVNAWQGGGSHATTIVYPIGATGPVWWDPQQATFSDTPPASLTSQSSSFSFMTVDQQGAANGATTTPNSGTTAGVSGSGLPGSGIQLHPESPRLDLPRDSEPGGDRGGNGSRPGELRGRQGDGGGHHPVEPVVGDDRGNVRRSDRNRDPDPSRTDLPPTESADAPTDPARPGDDRVPGDGRVDSDHTADDRRPASDNQQGQLGSHPAHTTGTDRGREGGVESAAQRRVADNGDIRGVVALDFSPVDALGDRDVQPDNGNLADGGIHRTVTSVSGSNPTESLTTTTPPSSAPIDHSPAASPTSTPTAGPTPASDTTSRAERSPYVEAGGARRPRNAYDTEAQDAWANNAYDHIRSTDNDIDGMVAALADVPRHDGSVGFDRAELERIKNHLFREEHPLSVIDDNGNNIGIEYRRYDAYADIAEAWMRMTLGRATLDDIVLLEHELAEAQYYESHPGAPYQEAHQFANQSFNWEAMQHSRTGESIDEWSSVYGDVSGIPAGVGDRPGSDLPVRRGGSQSQSVLDDQQGGLLGEDRGREGGRDGRENSRHSDDSSPSGRSLDQGGQLPSLNEPSPRQSGGHSSASNQFPISPSSAPALSPDPAPHQRPAAVPPATDSTGATAAQQGPLTAAPPAQQTAVHQPVASPQSSPTAGRSAPSAHPVSSNTATAPSANPAVRPSTDTSAEQSPRPTPQTSPTPQQIHEANQSRAARDKLRRQRPDGEVRPVTDSRGNRRFTLGRFTTAFSQPVSMLRIGLHISGGGRLDPAVVQALIERAQFTLDLRFNRGSRLPSGDWMMFDLVPVSDPAAADMSLDLDPANPHSTPTDADLDALTTLIREQLGLDPATASELSTSDVQQISNELDRATPTSPSTQVAAGPVTTNSSLDLPAVPAATTNRPHPTTAAPVDPHSPRTEPPSRTRPPHASTTPTNRSQVPARPPSHRAPQSSAPQLPDAVVAAGTTASRADSNGTDLTPQTPQWHQSWGVPNPDHQRREHNRPPLWRRLLGLPRWNPEPSPQPVAEPTAQPPAPAIQRADPSNIAPPSGDANEFGATPYRLSPPFRTRHMQNRYDGEHLPGNNIWRGVGSGRVDYFDETGRQQFRVQVRNGRLYDANGELLDTRRGRTTWGQSGRAVFAMDQDGNLYASLFHSAGIFHHSSFLAGAPVAAAGELVVVDGILQQLTDSSGHYQPERGHTLQAINHLRALGIRIDTSQVRLEAPPQ
ncbi:toxin glutamine deamidase domain-containing protein [Nocardia sp. NPDC058633]|uniref:toxin glutamine deamidase domain-containing protein n=1 Tax=Nocardia sp. NPDC058633 TaxID=3346568 RepID=UPI0036497819